MTQTELDAAKPIRPRKHRMMRRAEAERRRREYNKRADMLTIELGNVPYWRCFKRANIEDAINRNRELARLYGEVVGVDTLRRNKESQGNAQRPTRSASAGPDAPSAGGAGDIGRGTSAPLPCLFAETNSPKVTP